MSESAVTGRLPTPAPPTPKSPPPAPKRRKRGVSEHQIMRAAALFVLVASGLWWFITDGPQKFMGTRDTLQALMQLRGYTQPLPFSLVFLVYLVSAIIGSSGQALLTFWWGWFTENGPRLLLAVLFVVGWVAPTTAFDVALSAIGMYGRFMPLTLDRALTSDGFMQLCLGVSTWGSVVAQLVCTTLAVRMLQEDGDE